MSRGPATFRQSDLTRAIKAAKAAGIEVVRIEVDKDGKIAIITGRGGDTAQANDLDAWMSKRARAA